MKKTDAGADDIVFDGGMRTPARIYENLLDYQRYVTGSVIPALVPLE